LNSFDNLAQPKHENPITPWLSENGKAGLKNIVTFGKNNSITAKNHMPYHALKI